MRAAASRACCRIVATDNYGLTEVIGPGVAGECECRCGMHVTEDHFLVECLDPDDRASPCPTASSASWCSPR